MKKLLSILSMVLVSQITMADEPQTERLITLLESADNVVARFDQRTYKEASAKVDRSTGVMRISKPLKFNWTVMTPYEQQVISDGETMWVFDPDLEQATYQPISDDIAQSPAMILVQPRQALTGKYDVIEAMNGAQLAYKLYPMANDSNFAELMLVFKDSLITEIRILDSLNQETIIEFSDVKVDQNISADVFDFVAPPGTDLFEQM